jgi:hypothetical protein
MPRLPKDRPAGALSVFPRKALLSDGNGRDEDAFLKARNL